MAPSTKKFSLRTILTCTTGRLLTESDAEHDGNGIGWLYELLGWMTNDSPFTHQLGRFSEECKPWLLRWFPELVPCETCLDKLDGWLGTCREKEAVPQAILMWITELKMMFPEIKDAYDVPRIPADGHERKHPYDELVGHARD